MEKTNVMRILDQKKISYQTYDYSNTNMVSGEDVASILNQNPKQVFKTLVATGISKKYYVFLIPVCRELDLKKAAYSVDEKSIEMVRLKDLLPLTGYIHGGCSPIGMKKSLKTIIDQSASCYETIIFSAGKIGYQVEIQLHDFKKLVPFLVKNITV